MWHEISVVKPIKGEREVRAGIWSQNYFLSNNV